MVDYYDQNDIERYQKQITLIDNCSLNHLVDLNNHQRDFINEFYSYDEVIVIEQPVHQILSIIDNNIHTKNISVETFVFDKYNEVIDYIKSLIISGNVYLFSYMTNDEFYGLGSHVVRLHHELDIPKLRDKKINNILE